MWQSYLVLLLVELCHNNILSFWTLMGHLVFFVVFPVFLLTQYRADFEEVLNSKLRQIQVNRFVSGVEFFFVGHRLIRLLKLIR